MRILESLYRVELSRDAWLAGVLDAAAPILAGDAGIGMLLYDIASDTELRVDAIDGRGLPPGWLQAGLDMYRDPQLATWMIGGYRSMLCEAMNEVVRDPRVQDHYPGGGEVRGQVIMNGGDGSGKGCALHLFSNRACAMTAPERDVLSRIATHLATAYRLQRRLSASGNPGGDGVEAVLTPGGRVEHAEGEAKEPQVRSALTLAVQQRELSRRAAASRPDRVLRARRGLIAARWTLVDDYQRGGRRYVLARENEPDPGGPPPLSRREQQVTALAALGRSNKLIAYELGLAHSTVRVLVSRACVKLGVSSRSDLVVRLAGRLELAERR